MLLTSEANQPKQDHHQLTPVQFAQEATAIKSWMQRQPPLQQFPASLNSQESAEFLLIVLRRSPDRNKPQPSLSLEIN
jgi:hypothetical protein